MYNQNQYGKNPPGVPAPGQPMVMQQQQQQPQVVVVQQPSHFIYRPPVYEGLAAGQLRTSGILQIIIGVFAFLINIMARVTIASLSIVGIGFWGGIIFIVSGSMSIAASSRPTQPMVTASAAFSIIAGVLACIMIALSAAGISSDVNYGVFYYYLSYYSDPEGWYNAAIAANSILLVLGVVELCMTLWQAVICFNALCNMTPVAPPPLTVPGVQLVTQPQQQQQQQQQSVIITGPGTSTYPPVPYNAAAAQPPPYNPNYDNKY